MQTKQRSFGLLRNSSKLVPGPVESLSSGADAVSENVAQRRRSPRERDREVERVISTQVMSSLISPVKSDPLQTD
jgi:hypothetical protein